MTFMDIKILVRMEFRNISVVKAPFSLVMVFDLYIYIFIIGKYYYISKPKFFL